jgi:hypothetical protein
VFVMNGGGPEIRTPKSDTRSWIEPVPIQRSQTRSSKSSISSAGPKVFSGFAARDSGGTGRDDAGFSVVVPVVSGTGLDGS